MTLLPAIEITQMRDVCEDTFDGTAIIQAKTITADGGGGGTSAWTASGTVACHLSPLPPDQNPEPSMGGRISAEADRVLTLPANTTITEQHRVVIDNVTYSVEAIKAPRTWELTRRVEVQRLD